MSGSPHDDELAAFQAALSHLQPVPDGVNVARLLFRAGQLSAARRGWAWPSATAVSLMLATTLVSVLLLRPPPQPAERIVQGFVPSPNPPSARPESSVPPADETPGVPAEVGRPSGGGDYLRLRREVLARGADGLPPPAPWPAVAPVDDADTLLDMPRDSRDTWFIRSMRSLKPGDAS